MKFISPSKTVFAALCTAPLAVSALLCSYANAADMIKESGIVAHTPTDIYGNAVADDGVCASDHVLSRVAYNFYHEVRHVPELREVRIKSMANPTLDRIEVAPAFYGITRHYCNATAIMDDGSSHQTWYMVEDGQGFTGIAGMNVEFCVDGFDKWRIQDGSCRAIR